MSLLTPDQMQQFDYNRLKRAANLREQNMRERIVEIVLERTPSAKVNDPIFQEDLSALSKILRASGLAFLQRGTAFDASDELGYPLPEFWVYLKDATPAVIASASEAFGAAMQAWCGRKVCFKFGDIEAEARYVTEVERLLKLARDYQNAPPETEGD
jgi:hypothetical protein